MKNKSIETCKHTFKMCLFHKVHKTTYTVMNVFQDVPETHNSPEMAEAAEMSIYLLGRQTDGERSMKFDQTSEELQISVHFV